MDILYNKEYIIKLFNTPFYNIEFDKSDKSVYGWNNFKEIFIQLFTELYRNLDNKNNFIKIYYFIIILYIYYTNFLKFNYSKDFYNPEIYFYIKSLNNHKEISKKLFKYSDEEPARKIIKYLNRFIYSKLKSSIKKNKNLQSYQDKIDNFTEKLLTTSITVDKFLSFDNDQFKKVLSIIKYRYMSSLELKLSSYHEFYIKYLSMHKNNNSRYDYQGKHFNKFINQIPQQKEIVDFNVNDFINRKNITCESILNFILQTKNQFYISSQKNIKKNISIKSKKSKEKEIVEIIEKHIIITNKNSNSEIKIILNSSNCNQYYVEFDIFQSNLSIMHFMNEYINDLDYLKDTDFFMQINVNSDILNDASDILDFFHYLTISFKIIENYPTDINEFISPLSFNNYYYDSFYYFFKYFKNDISSASFIGKFIIETIKFIYIYSYYDYFIYYKNDLADIIINNIDKEDQIFKEFYTNFKETLKIGEDLIPYPPFCDVTDDINRIIFYCFEIPSYFKLFDLCNAFVNVHNFENKQNITPLMIIMFITEMGNNHISNIKQSNKISKNKNSYKEIRVDNPNLNYIFNTDTK